MFSLQEVRFGFGSRDTAPNSAQTGIEELPCASFKLQTPAWIPTTTTLLLLLFLLFYFILVLFLFLFLTSSSDGRDSSHTSNISRIRLGWFHWDKQLPCHMCQSKVERQPNDNNFKTNETLKLRWCLPRILKRLVFVGHIMRDDRTKIILM